MTSTHTASDTKDGARPVCRGRLLVVEDDADARDVMCMVFEDQGYEVASAANGLEALDQLHDGPAPDVILCDLMMPAMDGWEFCARKDDEPRLAAIPVVVVSAVANMRGVRSPPGDAVLPKPVDMDQLLGVVEQMRDRDELAASRARRH